MIHGTLHAPKRSLVWKAGEQGRWSKDLLTAALSRSDTPQGLTILDGRPQELAASGEFQRLAKKPAYFIERNGGLRTTLLMLNTHEYRVPNLGYLAPDREWEFDPPRPHHFHHSTQAPMSPRAVSAAPQ